MQKLRDSAGLPLSREGTVGEVDSKPKSRSTARRKGRQRVHGVQGVGSTSREGSKHF